MPSSSLPHEPGGGLADLPHNHFSCILADPPWAFRTFSGENMTPHRCAEDHYKTMTLAEMKSLHVADLAAKDCALFMWVAGPYLELFSRTTRPGWTAWGNMAGTFEVAA